MNEIVGRVENAIREEMMSQFIPFADVDFSGIARAAISAMREPTEAMCKAGWYQDGEFLDATEYGPGDCRDIWGYMIDAALK